MNNGKSRNSEILSLIILLSFSTNLFIAVLLLSIQAILTEEKPYQRLDIIGIVVTITTGFVAIIYWYINKINDEKNKLLEENRKFRDNQLANKNSVSDLSDLSDSAGIIRGLLKSVEQNPNLSLSTLDKEKIISVINMLDNFSFSLNAKSHKVAETWLNKEKLELSESSANFVLTHNPFTKIEEFETKFLNKKKSKHHLRQSIHNCLIWIQHSFQNHYYTTTNNFPEIPDKERTIGALNWIKTQMPDEIPPSSIQELEMYFDQLIKAIKDIN